MIAAESISPFHTPQPAWSIFMYRQTSLALLLLGLLPSFLRAADPTPVQEALSREIIGPRQAMLDVQDRIEPRIPRMPQVKAAAEWDKHAERIRRDVLDRVVFRGEARGWRGAKCQVKWFDTIPGGPGYRIKKLRYEA